MTNYNIKNDCRGMYEEEIFNTILEERGINNIDKFLEPTEDALLPLEDLVNIDKAADRVIEAIKNKENKIKRAIYTIIVILFSKKYLMYYIKRAKLKMYLKKINLLYI